MGHCCLSVIQQDFAHLGQIYLEDLVFEGRKLVNDDWLYMDQNALCPFQEPQIAEDGRYKDDYSLQLWLPADYD